MQKGECILPSAFSDRISLGETLKFDTLSTGLWDTIIATYNETAEHEGWPQVPGPWN